MAEAAAFGLAVNILTVVDFGRQFATAAWKVYQDGIDGVNGLGTLKSVSKDLHRISTELLVGEADPGLVLLVQRCETIAQRILATLNKLDIPESTRGRTKKRKAIGTAFRLWWKSTEIKELETELDNIRSEVVANIAFSLR